MALSISLLALGLFKPEHTELSIVATVLLFLLSLSILNSDVTYKSGTFTNSSFGYTTTGNLTLLTTSNETVTDLYSPLDLGGNYSHVIGYWLAVMSVLIFIGIMWGLRRGKY